MENRLRCAGEEFSPPMNVNGKHDHFQFFDEFLLSNITLHANYLINYKSCASSSSSSCVEFPITQEIS